MIDRQMAAIRRELRDDLGHWIRRKLTKGVEAQGDKAKAKMIQCGVSETTLRSEWKMQRAAQLSVHARESILPSERTLY